MNRSWVDLDIGNKGTVKLIFDDSRFAGDVDFVEDGDWKGFYAFFNSSEDTDKKDERPFIEIWSDEQESQKARLRKQIATGLTVPDKFLFVCSIQPFPVRSGEHFL